MPSEAGFTLQLSATTGGRELDLATVSLSQPDLLNPQSPALWAALSRAIKDLPGSVRAVIVRGEGRSFSAGLDLALLGRDGPLRSLAEAEPALAERTIAGYQDAFAAFRRPGLVSVALVQGDAVGAGFQLALACDLRIAAEDARFSMVEISLGLVPDLGGTKRLLDLIGYSQALELCLTGRVVGAAEAFRLGLVNSIVAAPDLMKAGHSLVSSVTAQPRDAVTETKALLLAAADNSAAEQDRAERLAQLRQLRALMDVVAEDPAPARPASQ